MTSFRSPSRRVYMCLFLTRTCKGGSPPPPLQSRLPAENRPCGEAVPYSLRPRVGQDNTSLYCHALAPLTRPIPGPRPFGANASRCSKMLPAFLSLRCAPACGETARPIFFSRSKTLRADVSLNTVTVGRVSTAHPPPGFRSRVEGKYATPVASFRSPFHHPDIFLLSQNPGRLGENPPPPIKKVGALCAPTSPKPITAGSLACVTTPRWRRRSRGGLSATARPG